MALRFDITALLGQDSQKSPLREDGAQAATSLQREASRQQTPDPSMARSRCLGKHGPGPAFMLARA
jgi:hypothetical protein